MVTNPLLLGWRGTLRRALSLKMSIGGSLEGHALSCPCEAETTEGTTKRAPPGWTLSEIKPE